MRCSIRCLLTAACCLLSLPVLHAEEPRPGPEGIWEGKLVIGAVELRMAFKISRKPDGSLTSTMDSIDQGVKDLPVDETSFKDGITRLELKKFRGIFEGKLTADGKEIDGKWMQSGVTLPLKMKRVEKLTELRRPQNPRKPYPYLEEEVTFANTKAGITLAGTLTLPKGKGPFPAVVLISGSGPQDRDETLMGHKPFLVLADHLTRHGIAVLRADDRGIGKSTGKFSEATSLDFGDDAMAAVAYLKTRPEINGRRIGLVGHSEGGLIAPILASQSADIAFIVLIAGPGLPGDELLHLQARAILRAGGATEAEQKLVSEIQRRLFAIIKAEKDVAVAEEQLKAAMSEVIASLEPAQRKVVEGQRGLLDGQAKSINSPWFRFFLTFDPRPTLQKVNCPVLAIIGEKDLQVPPDENIPAIEKALTAAGNKDFTVKKLPKLNHLLQTCQSGAVSEYGTIEETISPDALALIAEWILKRSADPTRPR